MVRSELVTKLAHQYPNVLRKDIEKIIDIIITGMMMMTSSQPCWNLNGGNNPTNECSNLRKGFLAVSRSAPVSV